MKIQTFDNLTFRSVQYLFFLLFFINFNLSSPSSDLGQAKDNDPARRERDAQM